MIRFLAGGVMTDETPAADAVDPTRPVELEIFSDYV